MQYSILLAWQCSQSFSWTIIKPVSAELGWKSQPLSPYDVVFCCFKIHLHFQGSAGNWRRWSDDAESYMRHGGCWVQRACNITHPPSRPHHDTNPENKKSRGCCRQHYWFWHPGSPAQEHVSSWWQALPPESLTRRSTSIKQTSRLSALIGYTAVGDGPTWHCASEDLWGRKASQSPPLALSHSLTSPGSRNLSGF